MGVGSNDRSGNSTVSPYPIKWLSTVTGKSSVTTDEQWGGMLCLAGTTEIEVVGRANCPQNLVICFVGLLNSALSFLRRSYYVLIPYSATDV